MTDASDVFRQPDLSAAIADVERERALLITERNRLRTEIERHRPWRWGRFALGMLVGTAPVLLLFALFVAAFVFRR